MTTGEFRNVGAVWVTAGAVALIAFWEAFVRVRNVRRFVLLPPSEIVTTFFETPSYYLENTWLTATRLILALVISLVLAVAIGAALAAVRPLEHASQPMLVLILVTPWVAYISSIQLWVGRGTPTILFLVAFVTAPAFVYATVGGMRGADPSARELFRSVDATKWEVLWHLRLPAALPSLFIAARFNLGLGLAAAYFAEGAALSRNGLGEAGKRAVAFNQGDVLWTTILCTAILGIAAQLVVQLIERWLLHWHASQR